jgi:hypothetical protein
MPRNSGDRAHLKCWQLLQGGDAHGPGNFLTIQPLQLRQPCSHIGAEPLPVRLRTKMCKLEQQNRSKDGAGQLSVSKDLSQVAQCAPMLCM